MIKISDLNHSVWNQSTTMSVVCLDSMVNQKKRYRTTWAPSVKLPKP